MDFQKVGVGHEAGLVDGADGLAVEQAGEQQQEQEHGVNG